MRFKRYKTPLLFLVFCFFSLLASAQENRFIYIQSEDGKPFYVRMGLSVFSSTTEGYVLLSSLSDGNHQFYVGFPRNEFPEEEFFLTLSGQNEGFLLKYLNSRWVMMNIETLSLTEGAISSPPQPEEEEQEYDAFSLLLADVVDDSSILKTNTGVQEVVKKQAPPEEVQAKDSLKEAILALTEIEPVKEEEVIVVDSVVALTKIQDIAVKTQETEIVEVKVQEEVIPEKITATEITEPKELSWGEVSRLLLVREREGLELVYFDTELRDTVRLFMPVAQMAQEEVTQPKVTYKVENKEATTDLTITPTIIAPPIEKVAVTEEKKVEQIIEPEKKEAVEEKTEIVSEVLTVEEKDDEIKSKKTERTPQIIYSPSVNSDCSAYANNNDFLKIRKKIAAGTDNDKMVDAARKFFKQKCYTTEQIKNLSYLFLDDEGRYKFFDAAYPYTSDSNLFYQLESQLEDPYYIKRFQAMIQN